MPKKDTTKEITEEEIEKAEESGERVSGEPDQNLAAIGAGGIAAAAAGAAIGTAVGGPIGGAVGAAAGAIAGGVAGDAVAAEFDPKIEEVYWKKNFMNRPYYKQGDKFEDCLPCYRFGWESAIHDKYSNQDFESVESDLQEAWEGQQISDRQWDDARPMIREGFVRVKDQRAKK
jgi:hypothetical protein